MQSKKKINLWAVRILFFGILPFTLGVFTTSYGSAPTGSSAHYPRPDPAESGATVR